MDYWNYEELILLNNLIYLKLDAKEDDRLIDIVNRLLDNGNFNQLMEQVGNCLIKMDSNEWISLLNKIKNNFILRNMKIIDVKEYKKEMKQALFVDENNNIIVIFRGTATEKEWVDNGKGAYEEDTIEQIDALNYINKLEFNNIIVTGHSKGGNKAQYVSIFSPKVKQCVSIDGQGFSKNFINKYNKKIIKNREKITTINAKYDYINCLFNSISQKNIYIKTKLQINPFYYHKPNILLDSNGKINKETNESIFSKIINNFSVNLLEKIPDKLRILVIDAVINVIEIILCKNSKREDIFNILGEYLIINFYENKLVEDIFDIIYIISKILLIPLLFWNDFIFIEETNSKERLKFVTNKMKLLKNKGIKILFTLEDGKTELTKDINNILENLIYEIENAI